MNLTAFSRLVGVPTKWVLNTMAALDLPARYTTELARQLSIARAIHDCVHVPLSDAVLLARRALKEWNGSVDPITFHLRPTDEIGLTVDVYRLQSSFNIRLAELSVSYAPPARGRPRTTTTDPLTAASDWGLDLSLIRDNLRKSPLERLQQLDAMRAFARNVRRASARSE